MHIAKNMSNHSKLNGIRCAFFHFIPFHALTAAFDTVSNE